MKVLEDFWKMLMNTVHISDLKEPTNEMSDNNQTNTDSILVQVNNLYLAAKSITVKDGFRLLLEKTCEENTELGEKVCLF